MHNHVEAIVHKMKLSVLQQQPSWELSCPLKVGWKLEMIKYSWEKASVKKL